MSQRSRPRLHARDNQSVQFLGTNSSRRSRSRSANLNHSNRRHRFAPSSEVMVPVVESLPDAERNYDLDDDNIRISFGTQSFPTKEFKPVQWIRQCKSLTALILIHFRCSSCNFKLTELQTINCKWNYNWPCPVLIMPTICWKARWLNKSANTKLKATKRKHLMAMTPQTIPDTFQSVAYVFVQLTKWPTLAIGCTPPCVVTCTANLVSTASCLLARNVLFVARDFHPVAFIAFFFKSSIACAQPN